MGSIVSSGLSMFGVGDRASSRVTRKENEQTFSRDEGNLTEADRKGASVANNELRDLEGLFGQLSQSAVGDSQDINSLFKNALTKFATGTGNPNQQQIQEATNYVDQAFMPAAQTSYNRFLDQAQNQIAGRAASLGRSSSDIGYQREFAGQASDAAQDLSNQRGSLIAQRGDYLANQVPQNQLNSLMQGSQFFNAPMNQALQNRLSLLNSSTAQQNIGLNRGGYTMSTSGADIAPAASLGTRMGVFGNSLDNGFKDYMSMGMSGMPSTTGGQTGGGGMSSGGGGFGGFGGFGG